MCTAFTFTNNDRYFGRTLDLEYRYSEEVVITPRSFPRRFRHVPSANKAYTIIGIASVIDGVPLYYDGINEHGLCVAALNFTGDAVFFSKKDGALNVAPFEFIPWVLSSFKSLAELRSALENVRLIDESFSESFSVTPLHWLVSDKSGSVAVESVKDGLKVYDNPVGVLTNSPEFPWHITNLSNYMNITSNIPTNRFSSEIKIEPYSKGLGSFGLPGDGSSASRFIRASFIKLNSQSGTSEEENVSRFFHIAENISQTKGVVDLGEGKYFTTVYTSCYNADKGTCYYNTYEDRTLRAVSLKNKNLDGSELFRYPLDNSFTIKYQN